MANSKTKKPARTKRKRKTGEELEAKQAAAGQRRMVCHSTHLTTTVYILLSYSYHYYFICDEVSAIHVALTVTLELSQLCRNWIEQKLLERLELRRKKESKVKESLYKQLVTVPTRALPPIKYPPKITHDQIPVVFGVN